MASGAANESQEFMLPIRAKQQQSILEKGITAMKVRINPNGFLYMFRFWPHGLRYDGTTFAYSFLGFWWYKRIPDQFLSMWENINEREIDEEV